MPTLGGTQGTAGFVRSTPFRILAIVVIVGGAYCLDAAFGGWDSVNWWVGVVVGAFGITSLLVRNRRSPSASP